MSSFNRNLKRKKGNIDNVKNSNLKVYNDNTIGKALYDLSKIFLEIEKENK